MKQKSNQGRRERTCGCRGRGLGRRMGGRLGLAHGFFIGRMDRQGPLYNTRELRLIATISHDGKEY